MKTWIKLSKKEALIILVVGVVCFLWGKSQKPDIWFKSKEEYQASVNEQLKIALEKQKIELEAEYEKIYDPNTGKLISEKGKVSKKQETEKQDLTSQKEVNISEKKEIDLKINLPPKNALGARIGTGFNSLSPQWEVYGRFTQDCIFGAKCVEELSIGKDLIRPDNINGRISLGLEWQF